MSVWTAGAAFSYCFSHSSHKPPALLSLVGLRHEGIKTEFCLKSGLLVKPAFPSQGRYQIGLFQATCPLSIIPLWYLHAPHSQHFLESSWQDEETGCGVRLQTAIAEEDTGQHRGQTEPFPPLYLEDSATATPIRLNQEHDCG